MFDVEYYALPNGEKPIEQFIGFIQSLQDARISLERIGEIHNREDEDMAFAFKISVPSGR